MKCGRRQTSERAVARVEAGHGKVVAWTLHKNGKNHNNISNAHDKIDKRDSVAE